MTKNQKPQKLASKLYATVGLALCTALPVVAVVAMTKTPKWLGD